MTNDSVRRRSSSGNFHLIDPVETKALMNSHSNVLLNEDSVIVAEVKAMMVPDSVPVDPIVLDDPSSPYFPVQNGGGIKVGPEQEKKVSVGYESFSKTRDKVTSMPNQILMSKTSRRRIVAAVEADRPDTLNNDLESIFKPEENIKNKIPPFLRV